MTAIKEISTERLILHELQDNDYEFIFKLVNSPGWLEFIGDRNIRNLEDAAVYVNNIINNSQVKYWTVKPKNDAQPVGIITLVKRDYLDHYDIGFAFLPEHTGKGYSFEASMCILDALPEQVIMDKILAITTEENSRSIKLLEKLRFSYEGILNEGGKTYVRYALSADKAEIGKLTRSFFSLFDNTAGEPDFSRIFESCTSSAGIIKQTGKYSEIYDVKSFVEPRKKMLMDGTLQQFSEFETDEETRIIGNIAQRYSKFRKKGILHGKIFEGSGHKFFHFVKNDDGWRIAHVIWEDENL